MNRDGIDLKIAQSEYDMLKFYNQQELELFIIQDYIDVKSTALFYHNGNKLCIVFYSIQGNYKSNPIPFDKFKKEFRNYLTH